MITTIKKCIVFLTIELVILLMISNHIITFGTKNTLNFSINLMAMNIYVVIKFYFSVVSQNTIISV